MTKKKVLVLALAMVMALICAIGGTIAWLTDDTQKVVNTFTTSNIEVIITETDSDKDNNAYANSYQMIPGYEIAKDPTVTVKAGSEACYVFVKVDETELLDDYITYTVDTTVWNQLTDEDDNAVEGVYYTEVAASESDTVLGVLVGNKVTVNGNVNKQMMEDVKDNELVKLSFTAYAHQLYKKNPEEEANKFAPIDAWDNVKPADNGTTGGDAGAEG